MRPVLLHQYWSNLLFLHWPLPAAVVQAALPAELRVHAFGGKAWVGVVAFRMQGIRPPGCPPLPGLRNLDELNLRTYAVDAEGRTGVWFFSLDASLGPAVWIARHLFRIPYRRAAIQVNESAVETDFHARPLLQGQSAPWQRYRWTFDPAEPTREAPTDSLESFLLERYRLFARLQPGEALRTGTLAHEPYRFRPAHLLEGSTDLFRLAGLPEPEGPPASVLASPGFAVRIHGVRRLAAPRASTLEATRPVAG
jgi:uncharacterized protein YqjF (DUF2071 family)